MRDWIFVLACLGLSVFHPFALNASEKHFVRFRYALGEGAEECPPKEAIKHAVSARLGYEPWNEDSPHFVIAVVGLIGKHLSARVELRNQSGQIIGVREIGSKSSNCQELTAAIELAISIAIDPLSATRFPVKGASSPALKALPKEDSTHVDSPPQSTGMTPKKKSTKDSRAAAQGAKSKNEIDPLSLGLGLGGHVSLGTAPAMTGGFTVQTRLKGKWFSAAFEGRIDLPAYMDVKGGSISGNVLLLSFIPCFHYGFGNVCMVLSGGVFRGAGHDLADAENATLFYASGGARLEVELKVAGPLSLRPYGELLAPLTRITLRETKTNAAYWTSPSITGDFGLTTMVHF